MNFLKNLERLCVASSRLLDGFIIVDSLEMVDLRYQLASLKTWATLNRQFKKIQNVIRDCFGDRAAFKQHLNIPGTTYKIAFSRL